MLLNGGGVEKHFCANASADRDQINNEDVFYFGTNIYVHGSGEAMCCMRHKEGTIRAAAGKSGLQVRHIDANGFAEENEIHEVDVHLAPAQHLHARSSFAFNISQSYGNERRVFPHPVNETSIRVQCSLT